MPLWLAMVTSVDTARQQIVCDAVPSSSCENYIGLNCTVVLLAVNAVFSFNNSMAQAGSCAPECRAVSGSVGLLPCSLVVHVLHVMMLSGQVPADTMVTGQEALQRQLSHPTAY